VEHTTFALMWKSEVEMIMMMMMMKVVAMKRMSCPVTDVK